MEWTLDPAETRVLGSLVEKELSTPEYYPMTANALVAACNQKTNRDPVVSFGEEEVNDALATLQRRRLAGTSGGAYSRAAKYRHTLRETLGLAPPALSILAELMLRGPQTAGELRARAARMYGFESLEAVEEVLEELAGREQPLAMSLPRRPGQKEVRYAHLLSGEPPAEAESVIPSGGSSRVAGLEQEIAVLRERLDQLEETFASFRKQFE